jgi:hypothetical protein
MAHPAGSGGSTTTSTDRGGFIRFLHSRNSPVPTARLAGHIRAQKDHAGCSVLNTTANFVAAGRRCLGLPKRQTRCRWLTRDFPGVRPALEYQFTEARGASIVAKAKKRPFNVKVFLNTIDDGRTIATYRKDQRVFSQGDPADSVFFIQKGKVKVYVLSEQGKEAVVALHGSGDFFGEGCLTG